MKTIFRRLIGLGCALMLLVSLTTVVLAGEQAETAVAAEAPGTEQSAPTQEETAPDTPVPPLSSVTSTTVVVAESTPAPAAAEYGESPQPTQEPTASVTEEPEPTDEPAATGAPTQEPAPTEIPGMNASAAIILHGSVGGFQYGDTVTLEAVLGGLEGVQYTLTWECNPTPYVPNSLWYQAGGNDHGMIYQFSLDEENAYWGWRAAVDIFAFE